MQEFLKTAQRITIADVVISFVFSFTLGYLIWKKSKLSRWIVIFLSIVLFMISYFVLGAILMFLFSPVW